MIISIGCKCSDMFWLNAEGRSETYEGYVPKFIPGDFGDYINLDIDSKTGQILNWKHPTDEEILALLPEEEAEWEDEAEEEYLNEVFG